MFGGILKKLGTESYGISVTFSALALLCANDGDVVARASARASARQPIWRRFIDPPECAPAEASAEGGPARIYTGSALKSRQMRQIGRDYRPGCVRRP